MGLVIFVCINVLAFMTPLLINLAPPNKPLLMNSPPKDKYFPTLADVSWLLSSFFSFSLLSLSSYSLFYYSSIYSSTKFVFLYNIELKTS